MTTNELYMADQVERLRGKLEYVECFIEDIAAWSVANISDYDKIKRIREVVYSFHEQKRNEVFER